METLGLTNVSLAVVSLGAGDTPKLDSIIDDENHIRLALDQEKLLVNKTVDLLQRVIFPCYNASSCDKNTFEASPPTTTTDRVCKAPSQCDLLVEYELEPPTATSDRVCQRYDRLPSFQAEAITADIPLGAVPGTFVHWVIVDPYPYKVELSMEVVQGAFGSYFTLTTDGEVSVLREATLAAACLFVTLI